MPKRPCPFSETFSSQYKIHVGQHELSHCSVFGNQYRKEIYDKTKNLLFNGAKAAVGKIWTGEEKFRDPQPTGRVEAPADGHTLLRGQTLIGHDGKLTKASGSRGPVTSVAICCVCQKTQTSRKLCSQCDRLACSSCMRQCSSCCSVCCSVCSIIDYSGRYDEVVCCSCST